MLAARHERAGPRTADSPHAASAQTDPLRGRAKEKGEDGHWFGYAAVPGGKDVLQAIVQDQAVLSEHALQENPGLPLIIFGHSMGSVIATLLASTISNTKASFIALVLSGMPARLPAALRAAFGPLLAILRVVHGGSGVAPLVSKLSFEKFNAKFQPNTTDDDWLSRDAAEVQKYVQDPMCGFKCSVDFMRSFLLAQRAASSPEILQKLPAKLPVMLMVGGDDPCTVNDLGARSDQQVAAEFQAAARAEPKRVVYGEARHEILNELCSEEVTADLVTFLNRCLEDQKPRSRL